MARSSILFLLLALFTVTANSAYTTTASNFIKTSCSATTYPDLCVQSLSSFSTAIQQNPRQLAQTALSVSLTRAQYAKSFVTKLTKFKGLTHKEYQAIDVCLEEMGDSVDRLSKSVDELKKMGKSSKGQDFIWHMSNVETWVSAALTDDNTCLDGFSSKAMDGKIKSSIRAQVLNVAKVTSNALALCNHFASQY
ncbi:21 kDa protein-like [Argentina anserina]|uniref:21 kDa protein-like n=1 Tax=Argentina anserina TaxID=57926 RepID=UPI00217683CD|nr:21 kDa protein-like [Potentilla anserina]